MTTFGGADCNNVIRSFQK